MKIKNRKKILIYLSALTILYLFWEREILLRLMEPIVPLGIIKIQDTNLEYIPLPISSTSRIRLFESCTVRLYLLTSKSVKLLKQNDPKAFTFGWGQQKGEFDIPTRGCRLSNYSNRGKHEGKFYHLTGKLPKDEVTFWTYDGPSINDRTWQVIYPKRGQYLIITNYAR